MTITWAEYVGWLGVKKMHKVLDWVTWSKEKTWKTLA